MLNRYTTGKTGLLLSQHKISKILEHTSNFFLRTLLSLISNLELVYILIKPHFMC